VIKQPTNCPNCESILVETGAHIFCKNADCSKVNEQKIIHFLSKFGIDAKGIDEKTIKLLLDMGKIKTIPDIYKLTLDDFLSLDSFKEKKAQNMLDSLKESKNTTLTNFLSGICIEGVGQKMARILSLKFGTIENIKKQTVETLSSIDGIGEVLAQNIVDYFNEETTFGQKNNAMINELIKLGFNIKTEKLETTEHKEFTGKTIVITGSFAEFNRNELTKKIESFGAKVSSSVTSKTNILIIGENAGSKLAAAEKLGIRIITEEELKKLI
jgi:DNA ligase (NAD+)